MAVTLVRLHACQAADTPRNVLYWRTGDTTASEFEPHGDMLRDLVQTQIPERHTWRGSCPVSSHMQTTTELLPPIQSSLWVTFDGSDAEALVHGMLVTATISQDSSWQLASNKHNTSCLCFLNLYSWCPSLVVAVLARSLRHRDIKLVWWCNNRELRTLVHSPPGRPYCEGCCGPE